MSVRLVHPCPAGTPTDAFGWRAAIPAIGMPAQLHAGQDWAAPEGTPIRAAHAGIVRYAGWDPLPGLVGAGYAVRIGAAQCSTVYMHMQSVPLVAPDDYVEAGQIIGWVGSTGYSTGAHLHMELHLPGGVVDPTPYIEGDPMTPEERRMLAETHKILTDLTKRGSTLDSWRAEMRTAHQAMPAKVAAAILDTPVTRHGAAGQRTTLRTLIAKAETLLRRGIRRGDRAVQLLGDPRPADAEPDEEPAA